MIYKEAELRINPEAGGLYPEVVFWLIIGTPLCPFDCDCCMYLNEEISVPLIFSRLLTCMHRYSIIIVIVYGCWKTFESVYMDAELKILVFPSFTSLNHDHLHHLFFLLDPCAPTIKPIPLAASSSALSLYPMTTLPLLLFTVTLL